MIFHPPFFFKFTMFGPMQMYYDGYSGDSPRICLQAWLSFSFCTMFSTVIASDCGPQGAALIYSRHMQGENFACKRRASVRAKVCVRTHTHTDTKTRVRVSARICLFKLCSGQKYRREVERTKKTGLSIARLSSPYLS